MAAPTRSPVPESSDNPGRASAQAAIAELGQVALVQNEIRDVLDVAMYLVCEVLDVELAKVLRQESPGQPLTLVAGCGWHADVEVGKATVPCDRDSQGWYTLATEEPVLYDNLAGDERFRRSQLLEDHGVVSGISVMIPGLYRPYGVVGAHTARRREFTPTDADFLRSVANVLGSAVENHRIREQIEGKVRYETALAECAQALLASSGEDRLMHALEALLISTQTTYVFVERNVMDPELGFCSQTIAEAEPPGASDSDDEAEYWNLTPWDRMPISRSYLERGEVFNLIPSQLEGVEYELYAEDPYPVKSELDIPIFVDGEWAGLIGFADEKVQREWSAGDISLLTTAAKMIGAFWERETARRRLEEMSQAKDEFLASISHELRTPLTSVMGYAQLLRDRDDDLSGPLRREAASSVLKQAADLEHIVNDLLVAAKAEMGELTVTRVPVNLSAQTSQVLEEYGGRSAGIEVTGMKVRALGDPARVRQVLRNLITNALRYGGEKVRVEIADRSGSALLRVIDDGPGIPPEDRERIFQPRQRVASTPGLTAALGLGLTISSQLAQMMGGDLVYRYEGESVFELSLPVSS
ncbi:MAG: GAF domain-containing protein [Acidimicrobiia bacterium]|nr:GAF domain-containing protein [Acidimicrobiia bacterium]